MRSTSLHTEAAGAAPPDAFGPFRVLHQIGAGTLGPVFRAYDPEQDRLVAVKLFQLDLPPERVHQLVDALQTLVRADLGHPAIAAPVAAGITGASAYLAQDFVAADSLDIIVREFGPAPAVDAVRVAAQLAGALDFAAAVDIRHGALHPRDVLLASDDARMTGLGVTQVLERIGVSPSARRPYAAPERPAGHGWDRRADVFSLAALIAEMIMGRRISGQGARAVEALPESAAADMIGLRSVFARALSERPGERYPTALEFAEALKQVVDRSATDAAPGTAPQALPPPSPPSFQRSAPELPLEPPVSRASEALLPGDVAREPAASDTDLALFDPESEPGTAAADAPGGRTAQQEPPQSGWTLHPPPSPKPADGAPMISVEAAEALRTMARRTWDPPETQESPAEAPPAASAPPEAARAAAASPTVPVVGPGVSADPSASAVWPIALALMVGLIVGVAVGFFVFANRGEMGETIAPQTASASGAPTAATAQPPVNPGSAAGQPTAAQAAATTAAPAASADSAANPAADAPAASAAQPRPLSTAAPSRPVDASRGASSALRPPATSNGAVTPRAPSAAPPSRERSRSPEPPASARPPAPAELGRLLVRSSPAGARVLLDGKDVGATPVTLRSLPFGAHTLRVTRTGYESDERRVIISTGQPAQSVIVDLTRSRAAGAAGADDARFTAPLLVESRPAGASVFLNGRRMGTTPLTLDTVATGSHALRLELDGYRRWTSSVRVVAGQRNRVTASLEQ